MDSYFKLLCAEEEIIQLNIEIPWFITFLCDEDAYLASKGEEVGLTNPGLAYQIYLQHNSINHFTPHHVKTLNEVGCLLRFCGSLTCELHIEPASPFPLLSLEPTKQATFEDEIFEVDKETELEEEQAGEDEKQVVMGAYCRILEFT